MPLKASADEDYSAADLTMGVKFGMIGPDGQRVVCRVSMEALQDRAGRDGTDQDDLMGTFHEWRSAIEKIASDNFDAGEAAPLVRSDQLYRL